MNILSNVDLIDSTVRFEQLIDNYLSKGYLDLLGILELVTVIEKKFDIKFVNSDFIDDEFVTIEGVCNIVEKKCNTIKELNHSKVEILQ
jgi:acyl carrier protein